MQRHATPGRVWHTILGEVEGADDGRRASACEAVWASSTVWRRRRRRQRRPSARYRRPQRAGGRRATPVGGRLLQQRLGASLEPTRGHLDLPMRALLSASRDAGGEYSPLEATQRRRAQRGVFELCHCTTASGRSGQAWGGKVNLTRPSAPVGPSCLRLSAARAGRRRRRVGVNRRVEGPPAAAEALTVWAWASLDRGGTALPRDYATADTFCVWLHAQRFWALAVYRFRGHTLVALLALRAACISRAAATSARLWQPACAVRLHQRRLVHNRRPGALLACRML